MHVHVIVAPSAYHKDPLKYRRHQLVRFLLENQETKIIWVCSDEGLFETIRKRLKSESLADGIVEIDVFDFKNIVKNIEYLQTTLLKTIEKYYINNKQKKYYLWYTYPAFSSLIKLGIWDKVIYDCSDLWNEMVYEKKTSCLQRIKKQIFARTEKKIVERSDQCFASSSFLFQRLARKHSNVMLIENGVDYYHFQNVNVSRLAQHDRVPTIGFIGGLKPWKVDFRLLAELAVSKRDWNIAVIGPLYGEQTEEIRYLIAQSNVKYTPYVPYEKVPEVIQTFDVGLLPYLENEYNQAVFPLKLFEYLAVGVPVVGCGLPSTLNYASENIYVHVPSRVQDVIAACESLMVKRNEHIEERRALARQADWKQKFELMWHAVNHCRME